MTLGAFVHYLPAVLKVSCSIQKPSPRKMGATSQYRSGARAARAIRVSEQSAERAKPDAGEIGIISPIHQLGGVMSSNTASGSAPQRKGKPTMPKPRETISSDS